MPTKPEMLNKGLHNAQDRILAPEGGLINAKNARYKPDDSAIWQAEGREIVADGGHGGEEDMRQVTGVQWDPGTSFGSPGGVYKGTQLKQILYTKDNNTFVTIEAKDAPSDPAMNVANAWEYTMPEGVNVGPDPLVTVGIENKHVILTGGKNGVLTRDTNAAGTERPQRIQRHGLPAVGIPLNPTTSVVAGNWDALTGRHFFWFTWYDSANDRESEANAVAGGGDIRGSVGSITLVTGAITYTTDQTDVTCDIIINKELFDGKVPASATGIRLYKAPVRSIYEGKSPWPLGYRIKEITFVADTDGNRFASYGTSPTFYLVYTFGDTSHTDPTDNDLDTNLTVPGLPDTIGQVRNPGGPAVHYSMNGEPPRATTGDVFQEALVLNDLDDRRKIRYSRPSPAGTLHSFPTLWFVNFETAQTDQVNAIRTLGNRLGVFLGNSVHRVNWLPMEADFNFQRGRTKDVVVEGLGVTNHYGVCKFTMPGQGPVLAFVDPLTGVYVTDLYNTKKISTAMDWSKVNNPEISVLVDDPHNQRLVLRGGHELWFFHYDSTHLDDGIPAITGPMTRDKGVVGINTIVTESDKVQLVSASNTGNSIYYEGFGFEGSLYITTREVYPFGIGNEGELQRFYVHLKESTDGGGLVAINIITGTADVEHRHRPKPIPVQERKLRPYTVRALAEYYVAEVALTSGASANAINFVGIDSESLGEAQSTVQSRRVGILGDV